MLSSKCQNGVRQGKGKLTKFGMHNNRNVVSLKMKKRILDQIAKRKIMTISHITIQRKKHGNALAIVNAIRNTKLQLEI